jgi:regulator of protease activity HflC (stomatin/prohibitin superfamily)
MSTVVDDRPLGPGYDGRRYRVRRADKIVAALLVIGLACLFLWPFTLFRVPSGHVGVIYRLLTTGTDTTQVIPEGLGIKWPWNKLFLYEMRTQALDETVHGLAQDGLSIRVDVTVLFHPHREMVGELQKFIGQDYVNRLVRPLSIEAVRDIIGKVEPQASYRFDVDFLEAAVLRQLRRAPEDYINFVGVIVRDVQLPPSLNAAITRKLTQEQNALAYDYIIDQAKKEAERKRVEAIGIQTFYSIVADALSPQLLTWRGIEATVQLAQSNNAKVVIVGGGKDQLPLILGSDIAKQQPTLPAPSAVDPRAHPMPRLDDLPMLFPDAQPERVPGEGSPLVAPSRDITAEPMPSYQDPEVGPPHPAFESHHGESTLPPGSPP